MSKMLLRVAILVVAFSCDYVVAEGRWSRQLTSESFGDWIPLESQPQMENGAETRVDNPKQSAEPRVLTHPVPFQSNFYPEPTSQNQYTPQGAPRQLFLQSAPSSQPAFLAQPRAPVMQLTLTDPRYPLAKAFVPQNSFRPQPTAHFPQFQPPVIQHPMQLNNQFYSQMKKPQFLQMPQKPFVKQEITRFVDGYKAENSSIDYLQQPATKKKTINLPVKTKQEYDTRSEPLISQQATDRASTIAAGGPTTPTVTTVEKEEVQLLYVPLETLQKEKSDGKQYFKQEVLRDSITAPGQINNQLYSSIPPNYIKRQQSQLQNIQQELIQQAFNTQTLQGQFSQNQYDRQTKYQPSPSNVFPFSQSLYPQPDITTPKSKKLKAHQPPLAIYMVQKSQDKTKLSDVLSTLKDAKGISVLDNIGPNSPNIFIGPSNLRAPNYYTKYDLPYLSSIDGNRIQRNINKLPFFVAPLSYKAPDGFAKIPFPAPHVGSVIVNPYMNEIHDSRPVPLTDTVPSSFSFTTFQHNPSTESYKSTISGSSPVKQTTVNYFPSATPNPTIYSQSTIPGQFPSFLPFDSFSSQRPLQSTRKPEPSPIITSSRQPLSSYFSTTPSKPTVSYFSFTGPDYSTIPTTPRPSSTPNYVHRGHYITNAANDGSQSPIKLVTSPKDMSNEKPITTPLPPSPTTFPQHNAYSINHVFHPTSTQGVHEVKNVKINEVKEYTPTQSEKTPFNSFSSIKQQEPAFIENTQYTSGDGFSPIPFYGPTSSSGPNEVDISSVGIDTSSPQSLKNEDEINQQHVSQIEYQFPSGEDEGINSQYNTEVPVAQEDYTTTTTTTTTTPAPTTKAAITRRPIHLRGRPRYTTAKPDVSDQATKPTTRRTPIRERKPSTYRTRFESTKNTNTEAPVTESSNFESAKKTVDTVKTNRYTLNRNKPALSEEEAKTTTESSLPKTSAATRNLRLRSRGKTHYRPSDSEGSDIVTKKSKGKEKSEEADLAYQRDVLHQNYPVTIVERISTLDVHTTPLPSSQSIDLSNGKIRIYETTGSTQRTFSLQDATPSDNPLQTYENEPVFQREQQKYLTQSDSYIDSTIGNIDSSSIMPELFINSKDSSTKSNYQNTNENYGTTISEQIRNAENYESSLKLENQPTNDEIKHENQHSEDNNSDKQESSTFEAPVARFRSKLRSRPKYTTKDDSENNEANNINGVSKKSEEHTEKVSPSTRRSSVQPVTYRPAYSKLHTTMKMEEIEAELKSGRQQIRSGLNPNADKHPVYVPESTLSSTTVTDDTTTKRNHFVRRRPARPTSSPTASPNPRGRTTTETTPTTENTNKRVRIRGRIRTRPTTTEKTIVKNDEDVQQTVESPNRAEEKYSRVTERTSQKYSNRNRQTQKYFKRPAPVTEKNSQTSQEVLDDQASYDSINRPEYIEYKSNEKDDYNPENGKAETQWSPKLTQNSFRPIFNPNLIADEIKNDGIEYGSKLSDSGDDEIITAKNTYEDVLVSVTPSSNTIDLEKSSIYEHIYPTTTYRIQDESEEDQDKHSDVASTFESMLEEVMRNLEQQDENEYNDEYGSSVMKRKGGEIGEIPPEVSGEVIDKKKYFENHIETNREIKKMASSSYDDSTYSTTSELKQTTTTERQPRRRGVWRKIKVRPVHKNAYETPDSQNYGATNNDLIHSSNKIKDQSVSKKNEYKKISQENTEPEKVEITTESIDETTILPTNAPDESMKNIDDLDLGTGSPELFMINMMRETSMSDDIEKEDSSEEILTDSKNKTVDFINESTEKETSSEFQQDTTPVTLMEDDSQEIQNNEEINHTDKSVVTEISRDSSIIPTTTEIPIENPTEYTTELPEEETKEVENLNNQGEDLKKDDDNNEKSFEKVERAESTTEGVNYWDPKNIISTSKSTEISHETEICYRGKCIKTKKQDLKNI